MAGTGVKTVSTENGRAPQLAPAPARAVFGLLGRAAPLLAAPLAADLFCRPCRGPRRPREERWLRDAAQATLEFEGGRLPIWTWGEASRPAVLLVHGWSGRGAQMGAFATPLVEAGRRVVTCDLPAHGEASGRSTHGVQLARAIRFVAESAGAEAVIAHSLGGFATALAVHEGLALGRLVLIAAPADVDFVTDYFLTATGFGAALAPRVRRRVESRVGRVYAEMTCESLAPRRPPSLVVVQDRGDAHVPLAHADRWRAAWSGEQWLTRGLGHFRVLTDVEITGRVARFLAGDARPGAAPAARS